MRPYLLCLFVLLLLPLKLEASPVLQLDEMLRLAIDGHPRLKAADQEVAAREAQRETYTILGDPTLQLQVGQSPEEIRLGLSQEFMPFAIVREERKAQEWRIDISRLERDRARFTLRQEVIESAFQLYVYERTIEFTEANIEAVREMARTAETKYAAGQAPQGDTMKAHFELTMLELERQQLSQEREGERARLRNLIRQPEAKLPSFAGQELEPPLLDEQTLDSWLGPKLPQLLAASFKHRLQAAKAEEAKAMTQAAEARLWPSWELGLEKELRGEMRHRPPSFMLGVTLPLWQGARRADVRARSAQSMAAELSLEAEGLSARSLVETQLRRLKGDLSAIKIYKTSLLPQATGTFQASRAAYNASRSSLIDLLDSERSLYRVKTGYLNALLAYVKNLVTLEVELHTVLSPLAPLPGESSHAF
jgi:outer membrane protein TolC